MKDHFINIYLCCGEKCCTVSAVRFLWKSKSLVINEFIYGIILVVTVTCVQAPYDYNTQTIADYYAEANENFKLI